MPGPVNWLYGVALVSMLDELAKRTRLGIYPFSECTRENRHVWEDGIIYMDEESCFGEDAVLANMCIDGERHDAISSWSRVAENRCDNEIVCDVRVDGLNHKGAAYVVFEATVQDLTMKFAISDGEWRLMD